MRPPSRLPSLSLLLRPSLAPQPATPQTINIGVITPPSGHDRHTSATSTPNPVLALMGSWSAWNAR